MYLEPKIFQTLMIEEYLTAHHNFIFTNSSSTRCQHFTLQNYLAQGHIGIWTFWVQFFFLPTERFHKIIIQWKWCFSVHHNLTVGIGSWLKMWHISTRAAWLLFFFLVRHRLWFCSWRVCCRYTVFCSRCPLYLHVSIGHSCAAGSDVRNCHLVSLSCRKIWIKPRSFHYGDTFFKNPDLEMRSGLLFR